MRIPYSMQVIATEMFAGTAADELIAALSELLSEFPQRKITFFLSGGGTPSAVFKAMSVPPRASAVDWSRVLFLFGDERWVPHDSPQSNYKMAYNTLLSALKIPADQIYPVNTSAKDVSVGAAEYEEVMKSVTDDGIADLVLLGMGDDGHTASIFPGSPLLTSNTDAVMDSATHPQTGQPRITLTVSAIRAARKIVVLVAGSNKREILKHVLAGAQPPYPIQLLEAVAGKVTFVADTAAVG